jgi:hypothetical protein
MISHKSPLKRNPKKLIELDKTKRNKEIKTIIKLNNIKNRISTAGNNNRFPKDFFKK